MAKHPLERSRVVGELGTLAGVALLTVLSLLVLSSCGEQAPVFHPRDNSTIYVKTTSGSIPLRVEVMDSDVEWQRGMMGRTELADDAGMLFVFPAQKIHDFWMKDTRISLDLLFFNADRELVHIKHDAPPCVKDPCPTFGSEKASQYVLEVNAGWAKEHGAKFGDTLQD